MITLETSRLWLRPYRESDLPAYHRLMSDRKNMYFLNDIATDTLEESLASLRGAIMVNEMETARRFAVERKDAPGLIGGVGYEIKSKTPNGVSPLRSGETPQGKIAGPMGWFILPEFQNQGYITEAARRVLEFAFAEDGCVRVVTGCYKDNIPTQKVMAKLEFKQEEEFVNAAWHDRRMKTRLGFAINRAQAALYLGDTI